MALHTSAHSTTAVVSCTSQGWVHPLWWMLSLYKSLPLTSEASEPTPILDLLTGSDGLEISAQEQGDGGWGSTLRLDLGKPPWRVVCDSPSAGSALGRLISQRQGSSQRRMLELGQHQEGECSGRKGEERWLENPAVTEWPLTQLSQQSCGPLGSLFSGLQLPGLWNGNIGARTRLLLIMDEGTLRAGDGTVVQDGCRGGRC